MAEARTGSNEDQPRRLPRGRHALAPEEVLADQRQRLVDAVPRVVARRGYEAMSVADLVKAAGVSRNAFYDNFSDKEECFAVAHEACQERLLALLERRCERGSTVEERVETALGAAIDMLSREPDVARLIFVEAPSATQEVALRYHEWLRRYGALLRSAVPQPPAGSSLPVEMDEVIVGGIASRVASEIVQDEAASLRILIPHLVDYVLAFCAPSRESVASAGGAIEPEPAAEHAEVPRRQASA